MENNKLLVNDNEKEDFIKLIVIKFYEKAVTDFMIGYHFRKIQEFESDNLLRPPIEAFSLHLPRIQHFWEAQLLTKKNQTIQPFDLINSHFYLKFREGELGRWVSLFKETLDVHGESQPDLKVNWIKKIDHFQKIFLKQFFNK